MNLSNIPGVDKRVIDPIKLMICKFRILLTLGGMAFIIFASIAYYIQSPYYESKGQVRIAPVIPALLKPMEDLSITGYYHDHIRTEISNLQSPMVIEQVLNNEEFRDIIKSLIPSDKINREKWYRRSIQVKQVPRTQLIEIILQSNNPVGNEKIINSLLEQYLIQTQKEEEVKDSKRLSYLLEVKKEIASSSMKLQNDLLKLAKEVGTGTFEQVYWLKTDALSTTQKSLSLAKTALIEAESKASRITLENLEINSMDLTAIIEDRLSQDESIWNTEFWTYRQLQNMRSTIDGITPENPDRIYVDKRMENSKSYLDMVVRDAKDKASKIENLLREKRINERNIKSEHDVLENKLIVKELEAKTKILEDEAKNVAGVLVIAKKLNKELEHLSNMEFKLNDRIHELRLDAKAPDRVSIARYANLNHDPAGTNLKKLLMMAALISFGSIGSLIFIKELRDDRIKCPEHVEMASGIPPSWPITSYEESEDFSRVVLDGITHPSARALRSLSFKLMKLRDRKEALKICFTGANPKCGVTSIAVNVAQTFSSTGLKVVIVEDNLENPSIQNYILNKEPLKTKLPEGFKGCWDSERKIEFIWPIDDTTLHFESLTEHYKENRDALIFDCSPLLISDAAEATAARTDVCIIAAQGDVSLFQNFRRCFKILWRQDIKNIIPVLNWIK